MAWSKKQIADWKLANKKGDNVPRVSDVSQRIDSKWQPPEVDCLKINVDASLVEGQNSFTIGMVLRNHHGHFLVGKTLKFVGSVSVMEAEMTRIFEALNWTQEVASGRGVIVESNSLLSVRAIQQEQENLLELGDLISQCRTLLRSNGRMSIRFGKKHANKVAHMFARIPCEINSFTVTQSPPVYMLETIMSEILMI
ncbi:uncharacterized protein LOC141660552 [Apium graveolens]|uniref:uncharacterized protein LOC141660552 n=1 Tax=Apium graveolens TaxID=4045 RepID=UPI003D7A18C9